MMPLYNRVRQLFDDHGTHNVRERNPKGRRQQQADLIYGDELMGPKRTGPKTEVLNVKDYIDVDTVLKTMKEQSGVASSFAVEKSRSKTAEPIKKKPLEEWQWKAIEAGDFALLKKYDTGDSDVDQTSDVYGTPLVALIDKFIFKSPNNEKEKYLNCFRWLIKRGANPLTSTPSTCTLQISYQKRDNENDKTKRVAVAQKNALQVLYEIKDSLPSTATWQQERERCRAVVNVFSEPTGKEDDGVKVFVDKKVVAFWEKLAADESSTDVAVSCANGSVQVHSSVLKASSKTFEAMFKHDMLEKKTMSIDLPHVDVEDFKKLRDLLYTGCLQEAPTDDELLDLFQLADQYQIQHLCEMLAGTIQQRLSPQNFEKFCQFATAHSSELLKLPCCMFAASNETVKAQFYSRSLSEEVMEELARFFDVDFQLAKRRRYSL